MAKYYIGIDPDVEKCGLAIWERNGDSGTIIQYAAIHFWDVINILKHYSLLDVLVVVEAGWLNKKYNYHNAKSAAAKERIANNVGRNQQVGILLVEYCKRNNISYTLMQPTSKKWTPTTCKKFTGLDIKNQDVIDAVKLVFGR